MVADDFVNVLLSQILHILYNGGHLIGLISGTTQLKEGFHDVDEHTRNHVHWLTYSLDDYLMICFK